LPDRQLHVTAFLDDTRGRIAFLLRVAWPGYSQKSHQTILLSPSLLGGFAIAEADETGRVA